MRSACPPVERLAAAASGEDDAILDHLDTCVACQLVVEEQSAVRALATLAVRTPSAPRLSSVQREQLGAEILARADLLAMPRRRARPILATGLAAAAVALALGMGALRSRSPAQTVDVATIEVPTSEPLAPRVTFSVSGPAPVLAPRAPISSAQAPTTVMTERRATLDGSARYSSTVVADREIVTLASGELTVDTNSGVTHPVHVVTGDTTLALQRAKVKVIATKGAIAQVSVFAGTAEITVGGKTQVIEAGMVWERPASPQDSSVAFQEGWAALREGRNADAIAAFDRAVDPMVAEDALYWAAIASERDGDPAGARQRYEVLVDKFPSSPRSKQARAALSRLAP